MAPNDIKFRDWKYYTLLTFITSNFYTEYLTDYANDSTTHVQTVCNTLIPGLSLGKLFQFGFNQVGQLVEDLCSLLWAAGWPVGEGLFSCCHCCLHLQAVRHWENSHIVLCDFQVMLTLHGWFPTWWSGMSKPIDLTYAKSGDMHKIMFIVYPKLYIFVIIG